MYKLDPDADISGVSSNDVKLTTTYGQLEDAFGQPHEEGDKSQAMWFFKDQKTGTVYVVSDWKEEEDIKISGKEYEFRIYSKKGFFQDEMFKDWLEIQLK